MSGSADPRFWGARLLSDLVILSEAKNLRSSLG